MASIGSLSSSTSTSIRGYGGLASGLDRDELIEGMTLGTKTKINKQEQKKQQIQWKQEAIQSISSAMIGFHSKYTETLTSSTNMFGSMLWGRNKITTSGENSKYVTVTGAASGADAITIMGIKQKAEDAKWSSSNKVSSGILKTGTINIDMADDAYTVENLVGKSIDFKYGESNYSIYLSDSDDYKYTSAKDIAEAVNELLKKQSISDDKTLYDVVQAVGNEDGTFGFKGQDGGNSLQLTGGSALELLGLRMPKEGDEKEGKVINDGKITENASDLSGKINTTDGTGITKKVDFFEYVSGKSLTFSYNGSSTTVKMPSAADLKAAAEKNGTDSTSGKATNVATVKAIAESIQEQLDKAFGKGRIEVDGSNGELSFRTTIPGQKYADGELKGKLKTDDSSVFSLTGGDIALIGNEKGALQGTPIKDKEGKDVKQSALHAGDTTRLNLNASIEKSGIGSEKIEKIFGTADTATFSINGQDITIKKTDTVNDIMKRINDSGAGVNVSYQEAGDKFTFTSTEKGASGAIKFSANSKDIMNNLFGMNVQETDLNDEKVFEKRGQDAIVSVKYAGSDEPVELRRDSNSFTIDGLTIGVKGTFGYDDAGNLIENDPAQAVEVEASADVDKLMDTIKSFVEEYNSIVDMVNTQLTTKHEKDYDPLTSEQKSELSDDEIEKWETKAKEGLLFGDSDLRSLSMELRVVVSGGLLNQFADIGINLSSSYSDNGKLSIDESKLRGALQTDPESVQKLFTSEAGVVDGKQTYDGLATNLKKVMDKYVNTLGAMDSKGILIRKAGSKSSSLSLTQNTYYDQIKSIDKVLESLKERLKAEQDRYISQFSSLETLIANMNSQSSYLSSMSGY